MSRFFVGQRVRLMRHIDQASPAPVPHLGKLGTIISIFPSAKVDWRYRVTGALFLDVEINCRVDWDGSTPGHQHTAQLEPAYDGNEVVTWESMRELWTPSGVPA